MFSVLYKSTYSCCVIVIVHMGQATRDVMGTDLSRPMESRITTEDG